MADNNQQSDTSGDNQSTANGGDFFPLRYPLDLGNLRYRHVMQIEIYTQNAGSDANRRTGLVTPPNKFDNAKGGIAPYSGTTASGTSGATGVRAAGSIWETVKTFLGVRAGATVDANQAAGRLKNLLITEAVGEGIKLAAGGAAAFMNSDLSLGGSKTSDKAEGYIHLYMPDTVQFVGEQNFEAVSMTEAMGLAGLLSQAGATSTEAQIAGVGAATPGVFGDRYRDAFLQKNEGYALNPQLEVLYNGPKNRNFTFMFKFTPRTAKEADAIIMIITTLRFHAAPEYSSALKTPRYIVPPSQFRINFYQIVSDGTSESAVENIYLPRISSCVLTNIDINYAPNGKYATFTDGMPTEIHMQLQFTETVILTKDDIMSGY